MGQVPSTRGGDTWMAAPSLAAWIQLTPAAGSRDEHRGGDSTLWGLWVLRIPPRPGRSSPPGMRGLSAAAGPGGRFTTEEPGVFMAGWNARSEHVMNLQRANEWIYF